MIKKVLIIAVITGLIGYLVWNESTKKKIAFVDLNKVFSEFNMTKELSASLDEMNEVYNNYLDSLNQLSPDPFADAYEKKYSEEKTQRQMAIEKVNYEISLEQQKKAEEAEQMVWKRLNEYVNNYGAENRYDMIIGSSGNGTVMYGGDQMNITDELIVYVNNKYNGF